MRIRIHAVYVLALTMMVVCAPLQALADAGAFTSGRGSTVEWDGGWTQQSSGAITGVDGDMVVITHEASGAILLVGFVPSDTELTVARDAMLATGNPTQGALSEIQAGNYDQVSYRVDMVNASPVRLGMFSLKMDDPAAGTATVYVMLSSIQQYAAGVSAVQVGVKINGGVAMNGVDPAGMQAFLELAQSTAGQTEVTQAVAQPQATSVATEAPATVTATQPAPIEAPAEATATQTETATATQSPTEAPTEAAPTGRTSASNEPPTGPTATEAVTTSTAANEYTDPTRGYTVAYDAPWEPYTDSTVGDFTLIQNNPVIILGFSGLDNPGASTDVLHDALLPTFEESLGIGGTVTDSSYTETSVTFVGETEEGYLLVQQMMIVDANTIVIVTYVGTDNDPASIQDAQSVTVNGVPILSD